ncbi:MAG: response regulator transcription factor [Treponema sp.]|nr:response regulator transcription factor [Treponema sp.]
MESRATVLIIEDDPEIQELLAFSMARENWNLVQAKSGEEGLDYLKKHRADCILLDIMLPGIDGFRVIKKIRETENGQGVPIIMATARGEETDIITGLELGADDYVVKPYSPKVLVARVRAGLRRLEEATAFADAGAERKANVWRQGKLRLDADRHEVFYDEAPLDLLPTEFALLQHFLSNPEIVFTRGQLISAIKGPDYPVTDRSIDVQILGLRKKLADAGAMIETVRGIGYRFRTAG